MLMKSNEMVAEEYKIFLQSDKLDLGKVIDVKEMNPLTRDYEMAEQVVERLLQLRLLGVDRKDYPDIAFYTSEKTALTPLIYVNDFYEATYRIKILCLINDLSRAVGLKVDNPKANNSNKSYAYPEETKKYLENRKTKKSVFDNALVKQKDKRDKEFKEIMKIEPHNKIKRNHSPFIRLFGHKPDFSLDINYPTTANGYPISSGEFDGRILSTISIVSKNK
jgi:hypothetical protein